jgi:hypothetical protein
MEEIKRRRIAINEIVSGAKSTSFNYTNVEFIALQFRKIFELIILATLASNQHLFEGLTRKLSKEWQVSTIVELVKKKNFDFYPRPINRAPSKQEGIRDDWIDVLSGYLSLDELIVAHGKIGNLMHANNPYKEETMLDEVQKYFAEWDAKVVCLLNNHIVKFPDGTLLYVGMQNAETGEVHTALFAKK